MLRVMRLLRSPPRVASAASALASWGLRSSRATAGLALRLLEQATEMAERVRATGSATVTGSPAGQPPPGVRPGVIHEVTEYVRRTIVSETAGSSAPEPAPTHETHETHETPPEPLAPLPSRQLAHLTALVHRWSTELDRLHDFAKAPDPVAAVHDLRVVSRRLRTFLAVFEPLLSRSLTRRTRRQLRRITRALGPLRELDVDAEQLGVWLRRSEDDAQRAALEYLLERLDTRRDRERRRAWARIRRVDFGAIRRDLSRALEELAARDAAPSITLEATASRALEGALGRVRRQRARHDLDLENATRMHRLRIATKHLRYTVELVAPTLGEHHLPLHRSARALQDVLGRHHDRVVLERLVGQRRAVLERRGRAVLARGLVIISAALASERRSLYQQFAALPATLEPRALEPRASAALEGSARH